MTPLSRAALADEKLDWVLDTTLFRRLSRRDQDRVLDVATWEDFDADAVVIPEGQPAVGVFLLVEGRACVRALDAEGRVRFDERIGPGHLVGEQSVLRGRPTAAEVRSIGAMRALHVEADAMRRLVAELPALRAALEDGASIHDRSRDILALLERDEVLRLLPRTALEALLHAGVLQRVDAGEAIVRAGERAGAVYVLTKGRAVAVSPKDGQPLRTFAPGALFGHAAMLLKVRRTADVLAAEACELLLLDAASFMAVVGETPALLRRLYRDVATMDFTATDGRPRRLRVAVVGGARGVGTTTVALGLAEALAATHTPVAVVDLDALDAATPVRIGDVAARSRPGRVDVYVPDGDPHALVEALAATHHLVLTGRHGDPRVLELADEAEARVDVRAAGAPRVDAGGTPAQTRVDAVRLAAVAVDAPWEPRCPQVRLPHVAGGRVPEAYARLARVVTDRAVGLALGGGGAFGYAHVGLIRAMHAERVPIDFIAGSSFGAVVAGVYAAAGLDGLEALTERAAQVNLVGAAGMVSTRVLQAYFDRLTRGAWLGGTSIPFLPVSFDLASGREVVLTRGTVGQGIRASSGLPGPYTAWRLGSWTLVDGGITNNVPASTVWEAGAGFVVGANVIPRSPGAIARRRGGAHRPRARFDDMLTSMYWLMAQAGRDRARLADWLVDFDLTGHHLTDFHAGARIAADGEVQARREVPRIRAAWEAGG